MAKKIIVRAAVKRQKGKLYFIDGNGNVVETSMNRKGGKKGRHVCSTKTAKKKTAKKKAAPKKKRVTAKRKATARKRK